MKIIKLEAENIKRIRAVEISPDGNVVVLEGRNEQGKSSVMDSIWFALGGKDALKGTDMPIREGEEKARVKLDLGELLVERTWTGSNTYLKVTDPTGKAKFSSPQSMLDNLVGNLAFDPLAFSHLPEGKQKQELLKIVNIGLDLDKWESQRKALYDERTAVNRDAKTLQVRADDMPVHTDAPDEILSVANMLEVVNQARAVQAQNDLHRLDMENIRQERDKLKEKIAIQKELLTTLENTLAHVLLSGKEKSQIISELVDPDLYSVVGRLGDVENINDKVRANHARLKVMAEAKSNTDKANELTGNLDAMDQKKSDAISAAKFPIQGLGFSDVGVTYKSVPFKQCSSAERLRVSTAIAMAANPNLRIIRIMDGSLLDSDNMAAITELAEENDFQVWIERVSDGPGLGIYIEDGSIVSQPATETEVQA